MKLATTTKHWRSRLRTVPQAGSMQVRFPTVYLEFLIDIILPAVLCPWGGLVIIDSKMTGHRQLTERIKNM